MSKRKKSDWEQQERLKFEMYAVTHLFIARTHEASDLYESGYTQSAWNAWLARARIARDDLKVES